MRNKNDRNSANSPTYQMQRYCMWGIKVDEYITITSKE